MDETRKTADEWFRARWEDLRNDYQDSIGEVLAALNLAEALGVYTKETAELWRLRLDTCPGHDDEGGREWCAYCGKMPRETEVEVRGSGRCARIRRRRHRQDGGTLTMGSGMLFTLTDEHLRLLRHAWVGWQDCESGAPEIDPKRPYGNSCVWRDVAEILGKPLPDDGDESLGALARTIDTKDAYERIHRETEHALQIVLQTGEFRTGTFREHPYSWPRWERVED